MAYNPGQDQQALGKNWNDFWGSIGNAFNRKINIGPIDQNEQKRVAAQGYGFSNRDQVGDIYNRNLGGNSPRNPLSPASQVSKTSQGGGNILADLHGRLNSPGIGNKALGQQGIPPSLQRPAEPDPMAKFMERRAQLESMLNEDYTGDPEVDAMIEQAYSSALQNVSKARGDANANFEKSDANIAALSAGHVHEIETKDRDAVNRIGGELQSNYDQTYGKATQELSADRDHELAARTEMLQRLGIQEAGLGDAGKSQSDAIARLTTDKAGAMRQAQGYQAADLVRNTEQAQSQASAGLERRGELHKQLQGILGQLDESEANINMRKSQEHAQAWQQGRSEFNQRQKGISDSISDIDNQMEDKKNSDRDYALKLREIESKNSNSGRGVIDVVNDSFRQRGMDPSQYEQAYAQVAANSGGFNAQVNGDKTLWMVREMKKKNPKLSEADITRYVMGVNNYGTDKLGG